MYEYGSSVVLTAGILSHDGAGMQMLAVAVRTCQSVAAWAEAVLLRSHPALREGCRQRPLPILAVPRSRRALLLPCRPATLCEYE